MNYSIHYTTSPPISKKGLIQEGSNRYNQMSKVRIKVSENGVFVRCYNVNSFFVDDKHREKCDADI